MGMWYGVPFSKKEQKVMSIYVAARSFVRTEAMVGTSTIGER